MIKVSEYTKKVDKLEFDFEHQIQKMVRDDNIIEDNIINIETSLVSTPKSFYDYILIVRIIYKQKEGKENGSKF